MQASGAVCSRVGSVQNSVQFRLADGGDDIQRRAERAEALVQLGELSAGRHALEGTSLAPGTNATLNDLQDPNKRPPVPREELPNDFFVRRGPPFDLDFDLFAKNLRVSRRGAAGGPSGMTADPLRPLLDSEVDIARFWRLAQDLARATVPDEIVDVVRLGRMTALCKPNGGVRGIVAGDMVRRLVARTISQQISKAVEQATSPFQYALSTKSGGECIAHSLQALTDLDPRATVLSIDGIGAFDHFLEVRCWTVCAQWQAVVILNKCGFPPYDILAFFGPLPLNNQKTRTILFCPKKNRWTIVLDIVEGQWPWGPKKPKMS